MMNFLLATGTFFILTFLLLLSVYLGHCYSQWQLSHHSKEKREIVSVAEGAVFALLGLLVAFTFTSAYERFEARKLHIIEEANAIETVYLQTGLLHPDAQKNIRETLREYLASRLAIYNKIAMVSRFSVELNASEQLRNKLWEQTLAACHQTSDHAVSILFIPAVIKMFDIANTRMAITKVHPPVVIFLLLIGLAMMSSFLAGYNMVEHKIYKSVHILIYVLITAFTLYVIIDLELPRLGLIRVDWFDQLLVDELDYIGGSHL